MHEKIDLGVSINTTFGKVTYYTSAYREYCTILWTDMAHTDIQMDRGLSEKKRGDGGITIYFQWNV